MSAEFIGIAAAHGWKAFVTIALGYFGWKIRYDRIKSDERTEKRFVKIEDKTANTYTKDETKELIENSLSIPKEKIAKMETMLEYIIEQDRKSQSRSDERDEKLFSEIQKLNTSVAVIQNDVQHLKQDNKENRNA